MKMILLVSLLFFFLFTLPAVATAGHEDFTPCCKDGASPWASESADAFKSNALAGYQGSELPPSTGFNIDHLDRYDNPSE